MKNKIHALDYRPKDIGEAIEELDRLNKNGQLHGLMFVVKLRGRNRLMVGAAGCCANDTMATLGAAGYMFGAVVDSTFNK